MEDMEHFTEVAFSTAAGGKDSFLGGVIGSSENGMMEEPWRKLRPHFFL